MLFKIFKLIFILF